MKTKKILIISGIIVFLGLAAAVSLGTYQLFAVELVSRPSVQFLQPTNEQSVPLDDTLVRFIARDKEGIEHVELWVDGELYASKKSELPQGSTPFPLVEMWQPDSAGQHVLTARVYNSKNRDATASVIVQVSEETIVKELPADLPPGDEGAEVPAPGDGFPPGEAGAEAPAAEEEEEKEYISMLDDSIVIEPLEGFLSEPVTPILDMISRFKLPGDRFLTSARLLEVEALSLETESGWDGLFCYLTLNDYIEERIPPEGGVEEFILYGLDGFWHIQYLLELGNSRIVSLDEDTLTLDIKLQCWGAIRDSEHGAVYDLGTLYASHDSSDWDGHTIDKLINGPDGWFRVAYRVKIPDEDILTTPILKYWIEDGHRSVMVEVDYSPSDFPEDIDGLVFLKDDTFMAVTDYLYHYVVIGESPYRDLVYHNIGPLPCGQTSTYRVWAYQGDPYSGNISPSSNSITINGPPCYQWAVVTFEKIYLKCLCGDARICHDDCHRHVGGMNPDILNNCTGEGEYQDYMGCSYGILWANEQKIYIGEMGPFGSCLRLADHTCYMANKLTNEGNNKVWVPLEEDDTLVVGMSLYDNDLWPCYDDLQCKYYHYFDPWDLTEIAREPNRRITRCDWCSNEGEGACGMQYTVSVLRETPPSDD